MTEAQECVKLLKSKVLTIEDKLSDSDYSKEIGEAKCLLDLLAGINSENRQ